MMIIHKLPPDRLSAIIGDCRRATPDMTGVTCPQDRARKILDASAQAFRADVVYACWPSEFREGEVSVAILKGEAFQERIERIIRLNEISFAHVGELDNSAQGLMLSHTYGDDAAGFRALMRDVEARFAKGDYSLPR